MYLNTLVKIWEVGGIVDELRYLALPHLRGAVSEYK
jgi:hypothetical protein